MKTKINSGNKKDVSTVRHTVMLMVALSASFYLGSFQVMAQAPKTPGSGTMDSGCARIDRRRVPITVVTGAGRHVALSPCGTLLTSKDSQHWIEVELPLLTYLRGLAFGRGVFVAVGSSYVDVPGVILTSRDGVNWQFRHAGGCENFYAVTFAAGRFVAVGDAGLVWTSENGARWKQRQSGTDALLCAVAFGNGTFVACGESGTVITSTDAVSWTSQHAGPETYLSKVTFQDSQFVLCGSPHVQLYSSTGVEWHRVGTTNFQRTPSLTSAATDLP